MKLKQYLTESIKYPDPRSKIINFKQAYDIITKNCSDIIKLYKTITPEKWIYRGSRTTGDALFVDTTTQKIPRLSANANNIYTLIMDHSNEWTKYPKRSNSLICVNNRYSAEMYGNPRIVFPYNGTNIGICPDSDLWSSFESRDISNLYTWSQSIEGLLDSTGRRQHDLDIKRLKESCKIFDDLYKKNEVSISNGKYDVNYHGDMYKMLEWYLNTQDFKLIKSGQKYDTTGEHEIWCSGKFVLLNVSSDELMKNIG